MNTIKAILAILLYFSFSAAAISQISVGEVTFTTSSNVYVRFENTHDIHEGDSLFVNKDLSTVCLIVKQKSSSSCVCERVELCQIEKGQKVFHQAKDEPSMPIEDILETNSPNEINHQADLIDFETENVSSIEETQELPIRKVNIRVRNSISSYSNLSSNEGEDSHRLLLRSSLNLANINGGIFSFESNINYRKNFIERAVDDDYKDQYLLIYNLATTAEISPTSKLTLGRKINRRASSLGSFDGVHFEKQFGDFTTGVVAGFKPDFEKFDFNPQLFQSGVFVSNSVNKSSRFIESTVGFLEQRNNGQIDRRFLHFQHSSRLGRIVSLFGSAELDLYQKLNGKAEFNTRLTNLFVSSNLRFSRRITFGISYDSRKRIIYYETYQTEVEKLLADDLARQGLRFRLNLRPINYLNLGISYSLRFQSDQQNESKNINGILTYSKLPGIGGSTSLNLNLNESNYLKSRIYSIRYTRSIFKNKINANVYIRKVHYDYINSELSLDQNYIGGYLNLRFSKMWSLNVLGEVSSRGEEKITRLNTKLIHRFYKK